MVVDAEDVSRGKPDPEIFLTAAMKLGVSPEKCIVFEDSSSGIEAAKRAGMKVVGVTTSGRPRDTIAADFTISNFVGTELTALLEQFGFANQC